MHDEEKIRKDFAVPQAEGSEIFQKNCEEKYESLHQFGV